MTAAELFTLGFLFVVGTGCIAYATHHINLAHRITTRYQAAVKVQGLYLENTHPEPRNGEVHVCNVNGNCAKGRATR